MSKKIALVLFAIIALVAFFGLRPAPTLAAADATCVSDPPAGPIGTDFVLTCSGYTPNSYVYAYLVEPAGVATPLFDSTGALKIASDGTVTYTQHSSFAAQAALATGTWHFVAEELGLAKTVLHRGETTFTVTGGTEGVSGASLVADPPSVQKAVQTYNRQMEGNANLTQFNTSPRVSLNGSGFAPNEVVTFWIAQPQGGCPSWTVHNQYEIATIFFGVYRDVQKWQVNAPVFLGFSAELLGSTPADANGNVTAGIAFTSFECEGVWQVVARGNASGLGAETFVTLTGNAVATNATLTADKAFVTGMFDTVNFFGEGYGPNEHISCWLASPRGQTIGYPSPLGVETNIVDPGVSQQYMKDKQYFADAAGHVALDLVTGSALLQIDETFAFGGNILKGSLSIEHPVQSEGALGEWAMTCRGDTTGNTGIARFTLVGGLIDP